MGLIYFSGNSIDINLQPEINFKLKSMNQKTFLTFFYLLLVGFVTTASAQEITVRGVVTETSTQEPLIGASVKVLNSEPVNGSITDLDGKFELRNVNRNATLEISFIGYQSQTVKVEGRSQINVSLFENSQMLNEVVVIGYGTMDKKELTSAVSHVSSKDFLSTGGIDPTMMIQGKVPGVSITNTGSGDPNNQASIQIRGVSSRSAGLGPLIVVDGVPGGNLTNINPNDIESFDILKDGAASAIYGTRGSNGVILVTTKKGSKDGSVHTSYTGTVLIDVMKRQLDMLDANEWRKYKPDAIDLGGNDDWLDAVSRTGWSTQHTLSLSGGNSRTNYRGSIDYRKAEGIDLRSGREEYGARLSFHHTTKGGLMDFNVNVAPRVANRSNSDWNAFKAALTVNPTTPIMNPDDPSKYYNLKGTIAGYNPVEALKIEQSTGETKLLEWDATAKLNLLPLLAKDGKSPYVLNTQLTFADHQYSNFNAWFRPSTSTQAINAGRNGEASRDYSQEKQLSAEWITNFTGTFFKHHNVKAMFGYSYQYSQYSGMSANNKDFANDALGSDALGSGEFAKEEGEVGMGSYKNDAKLIAFFGRVSYDYDGKYLFTASLRHEGSSKFGANHKWGNFPAVSLGWRISQEEFMKGINWIDDLKIRADYGVTGNQNFDSYKSLNTMQGFGYYYYNGKYFQVWGPAKNVNPDLKWEKGKNWNIGLDFSLFNSRLSGSLNYYNRTQSDLLGDYNVSVPPYLFTTTFVNVGTMKNSGFEIDLNWNAVKTKDFNYTLGFIGSTMNNKFVDFSNSTFVGQDFYDDVWTEDPYPLHTLQRIEKNRRIGSFYMLKYAGVDKEGNWIVYDKDGDMIRADQATDQDRQFVGNGLPKFTGSLNHNFTYKNWDLSMFFRFSLGFDIFNIHDFYYGTRMFTGNVEDKAFDKNAPVMSNPPVCDYFIEKGDYLKLDNLTLGYTLDMKKCRFIDSIRMYGTVKNLFTLTGFSGVDPDCYQANGLTPNATGSGSYYPSTRQFIFGVQVDF